MYLVLDFADENNFFEIGFIGEMGLSFSKKSKDKISAQFKKKMIIIIDLNVFLGQKQIDLSKFYFLKTMISSNNLFLIFVVW